MNTIPFIVLMANTSFLLALFLAAFFALAFFASATAVESSYNKVPTPTVQKAKVGSYGPKLTPDLKKTDVKYRSFAPAPKMENEQKPKLKMPKQKTSLDKPAAVGELKVPNGAYDNKLTEKSKPNMLDGSYGKKLKPNVEKPKTVYGSTDMVKPILYMPNIGKSKGEKPKVVGGSYGKNMKPNIEKPKSEYGSNEYKLKPILNKSLPTMGVQGLVYCQTGSKFIPLQGAIARVTCLAIHENENGHETTPFSILSKATDKKGYFFTTLAPSEVEHKWKLSECKAFLHSSPSKTCNTPTNVNNGVIGALLCSPHLLQKKNMKLFSVAPLVYTSGTKLAKGGY